MDDLRAAAHRRRVDLVQPPAFDAAAHQRPAERAIERIQVIGGQEVDLATSILRDRFRADASDAEWLLVERPHLRRADVSSQVEGLFLEDQQVVIERNARRDAPGNIDQPALRTAGGR